jgi:hypothetical protein
MTSPEEAGWLGSASRQAALPAPLRDLHRWLAARPGLDGQILGQQAAVERGRRNFGPLLGGPA